MMRRLAFVLVFALTACGSESDETSRDGMLQAGESADPAADGLAQLESRVCHEVAGAYAQALERRDFEFAARFWNDPIIDGARLVALFGELGAPAIEITDVREGIAAGTYFCTVTGALTDADDASVPPRPGKIVLQRDGDRRGTPPGQLRWTIRSSTFVEPMERSGKGEPA